MIAHATPAHPTDSRRSDGAANVSRPASAGRETDIWIKRQLARVLVRRRAALYGAGALSAQLAHCLAKPGKLLRPRLLLGFATLAPGRREPSEAEIAAATAIELLHESSLVHDDIADRSEIRRGHRSIAAAFTVRSAGHTGAYLAGRAVAILARAVESAGIDVDLNCLRDLARAQMIECLPPPGSTDRYLGRARDVIHGKTGVLLRLSIDLGVQFGARARGAPLPRLDLAAFSEALELVYQLRDDLLDLENSERLKRPGNNDLHEGRLTWPTIQWATSQADPAAAFDDIRNAARSPALAEELRQRILRSGIAREARAIVQERLRFCHGALSECPPSAGKSLLCQVLECLRSM